MTPHCPRCGEPAADRSVTTLVSAHDQDCTCSVDPAFIGPQTSERAVRFPDVFQSLSADAAVGLYDVITETHLRIQLPNHE